MEKAEFVGHEIVALLTESVDWNKQVISELSLLFCVALLTESVDWNNAKGKCTQVILGRSPHGERGLKCFTPPLSILSYTSLSSRRAWIEISSASPATKKSSSRSPHGERGLKYQLNNYHLQTAKVALLTESVDWNIRFSTKKEALSCRSPHGERGLKFMNDTLLSEINSRSPHGERGLKYHLLMRLNKIYKVALLTESVDWNLYILYKFINLICRSPHGERGLKYINGVLFVENKESLSSRRAWIEILMFGYFAYVR